MPRATRSATKVAAASSDTPVDPPAKAAPASKTKAAAKKAPAPKKPAPKKRTRADVDADDEDDAESSPKPAPKAKRAKKGAAKDVAAADSQAPDDDKKDDDEKDDVTDKKDDISDSQKNVATTSNAPAKSETPEPAPKMVSVLKRGAAPVDPLSPHLVGEYRYGLFVPLFLLSLHFAATHQVYVDPSGEIWDGKALWFCLATLSLTSVYHGSNVESGMFLLAMVSS
jgi:hypothetical protein